MTPARRLDPAAAGAWLLGLSLLLLVLGPLLAALLHSLADPVTGWLGLEHYRTALSRPAVRAAALHSLVVSTGGTAGAVLLGVPLAFLTVRCAVPGRRLLRTVALLVLLSPPFIGAYAWVLLLGRGGALRYLARDALGLDLPDLYGPGGIIWAYALQYYPYPFLFTAAGLRTVDRSLEEAAESLGAGRSRVLLRVTLPLVLPSVSAGALVAFVLAVSNFGTPRILGLGGYQVLPTLAYDLFTGEVGADPGQAAAVSLLLVLVASGALLLQRRVAARRRVGSVLLRPAPERPLAGARLLLASAACWGVVLISALPLGVIAACSFRETSGPVFQPGLGLDSYRQVLRSVPLAISNSFLYALLATLLIALAGAPLGWILARRRGPAVRALDALVGVPWVVPGTVVGIGLVLLLAGSPLDPLLGTGAVIVLACFVRRLPHAVRSSAAILDQIHPSLEEAAASLGAPPARAFWSVTLPLMAPGVLAGAALAFATSMGELSATLVLATGATTTMPVRIYQSVIDGSYGPASALSTLLLLATGLALWAGLRTAEAEVGAG